jgi:hypothetical protein
MQSKHLVEIKPCGRISPVGKLWICREGKVSVDLVQSILKHTAVGKLLITMIGPNLATKDGISRASYLTSKNMSVLMTLPRILHVKTNLSPSFTEAMGLSIPHFQQIGRRRRRHGLKHVTRLGHEWVALRTHGAEIILYVYSAFNFTILQEPSWSQALATGLGSSAAPQLLKGVYQKPILICV